MSPARWATFGVAILTAAVITPVAITANGSESGPVAATCVQPSASEAVGGVDLTVTCTVPTPPPVTETATATVTTTETATATATVTQTVTASPTPTPTVAPATRQVCMSSPADQWDVRLSEVGRPGITGRRIFNQTLPADGRDGATLIEAAVADGMTPVVSYKLPNFTRAALDAGNYDAGITAAGNYLNSLGAPVYATIWHEPSPDVSAADFLAIHRRLAPLLKKPNVKVGPILNTWVLDNPTNYPKFDGYVADDLIANGTWQFFGYDSYQSGDRTAPGGNSLATRMSTINSKIAAHGGANLPQVAGEYNAYEASTLTAVQNAILGNDKIQLACVFNSDVGSKGIVLTGAMLDSFKAFKANAKFVQ